MDSKRRDGKTFKDLRVSEGISKQEVANLVDYFLCKRYGQDEGAYMFSVVTLHQFENGHLYAKPHEEFALWEMLDFLIDHKDMPERELKMACDRKYNLNRKEVYVERR